MPPGRANSSRAVGESLVRLLSLANHLRRFARFAPSRGARCAFAGVCGEKFFAHRISPRARPVQPRGCSRVGYRSCRIVTACFQELFWKCPFHRRFRRPRIFCSEKRMPKKFLLYRRCGDCYACATACGNRASIHKIKGKPCYFFFCGVMRMTVQIDSRLHCTDVAIHSG